MIDPTKISNFNLTDAELEENILFWVCAAGKNGVTAAKCLNKFLQRARNLVSSVYHVKYVDRLTPFGLIATMVDKMPIDFLDWLASEMRLSGIGNHSMKSKSFYELTTSKINLRTCGVAELENIHGIGPKTSRAFLVHTRPNQRFAVIDTHILKFMRHMGIKDVPLATPTGKKYARLEQEFLNICDEYKREPAELDLAIWNHYRVRANLAIPFPIGATK